MKLCDLLAAAMLDIPEKQLDCEIDCILSNTEEAIKNKSDNPLFVCVSGAKYDTHNDIEKLLESGIRYIVSEREVELNNIYDEAVIIRSDDSRKSLSLLSRAYYGFPDKKLKVIGVTGTKGKTTVTYMLRSIFDEAKINCGIIGTNGIFYNGINIENDNTTPSSPEFYRQIRNMADSGVEYVICEVTSQALKQSRTYGTEFELGIFTNLYPDHIGANEHSSFEEYRLCKARLFDSCRKVIINYDDENSKFYSDYCDNVKVPFVSFSLNDKKEKYFCCKQRTKKTSTLFCVNKNKYYISLPGNFNVQNALCAVAAASELGIEYRYIKEGLSKVRVYGRCERVKSPEGVNIVIDYAHNKESLENILVALKKECKGKLYCVFGAGGDRSKLRRSGMGQAALSYADFAIVTNDNPRNENPADIISDIVKGMNNSVDKYTIVPKRQDAINLALTMAKKGDTVLLAGKGAQNYEEVCGVKYPFDERVVVLEYYNNKKAKKHC